MLPAEELHLFLRQNPLLPLSSSDYTLLTGGAVALSPDDRHHFRVVMRMKGAFAVAATDGGGLVMPAMVGSDDMIRQEGAEVFFTRHPLVKLITPPIQRKNLELLVKMATQAGVDEIIFIDSDYRNYSLEGLERYEKIVRNSAIQSRNMFLPVLRREKCFLIDYPFDEAALHFWGDLSSAQDAYQAVSGALDERPGASLVFINGPEGGYSPQEENFLKNRFPGIRLSENVLRSELAAIAALTCMNLFVKRSIGKN